MIMRPALESESDLAGMMSTDEFAVVAVWEAAGGEVELPVIVDAGHVLDETGAVAVSTRQRVIHAMDHTLPAAAAQGDVVRIGDDGFVVRDIRPDGTGMTVVILEAA